MTTEPITRTEALRLLLLALLAALLAFDVWHPTEAQTAAVLGLYAALSIVLSVFARQQSTPNVQVALTTADAEALAAANPKPPDHA